MAERCEGGQELRADLWVEDEITQTRVGRHPAPCEKGAVGDAGGYGLRVEGLRIGNVDPVAPHAGPFAG